MSDNTNMGIHVMRDSHQWSSPRAARSFLITLSGWSLAGAACAAAPLVPWLSHDGLYGFADANGQVVLAPQYDQATVFAEGRAAAAIHDHWGYIDEAGKWIVRPRFDRATRFRDGKALALIIREGSLPVREPRTSWAHDGGGGGCGFLPLCGGPKTYYCINSEFDLAGHLVATWHNTSCTPAGDQADIANDRARYDRDLTDFPEPIRKLVDRRALVRSIPPLYAVGTAETVAFFDASGRQLTAPIYGVGESHYDQNPYENPQRIFLSGVGDEWDWRWRFHDGRLQVCSPVQWGKTPKCGYLDEKGTQIIPMRFYERGVGKNGAFSGGLAEVSPPSANGSTYDIIDRNGTSVLNEFSGGMWEVNLQAGYALGLNERRLSVIDLRARRAVHTFDLDEYHEMHIIASGGHVALSALRTGVDKVEDAGVCVLRIDGTPISCGYQSAKDAGNGVIGICDAQGLWGAIDYDGHVLFDPRYKEATSGHFARSADEYGDEVPPFYFEGDYAQVKKNWDDDRPFYIDRHGREFRDADLSRDSRGAR